MKIGLDYAAIIDAQRTVEKTFGVEFIVRFCLVVITAFAGWVLMDLTFLPLWVTAYYALVFAEKIILAHAVRYPARPVFFVVLCISFLTSCVFAVLPLSLWYMDGDIWKFGAMVTLVGAILNIYLLRAKVWAIGLAYMIPISTVFFLIAFGFRDLEMPSLAPFWAALVVSIGISIYFVVAAWETNQANQKMKETQAQLVQAQKGEALGTLTSGITHDFNNILSVVQGNLELIKINANSSEIGEYVDDAIAATQRGAELTNQLLAYARRAELTPTLLDPADVLNKLERMATRILPDSIKIRTRTGTSSERIIADETTLQSALLNLVINASDSMPEGGEIVLQAAPLRITTHQNAQTTLPTRVRFDVIDEGVGIAADILDRVTDPFFTTKDHGKGSGLGLAMVQGFTEQSGGDLIINSQEGRGTRVSLTLPNASGP